VQGAGAAARVRKGVRSRPKIGKRGDLISKSNGKAGSGSYQVINSY
jgi:hypothetical protein